MRVLSVASDIPEIDKTRDEWIAEARRLLALPIRKAMSAQPPPQAVPAAEEPEDAWLRQAPFYVAEPTTP